MSKKALNVQEDRKDRIGRRGGGALLYIKDTIPAYEVQLHEEADCNEAIWCNLVAGPTTVIIGVVYRCPNITKQNNEKIHNAINEVSKGDCIIMGDFNHGNIKWDTLQSTGVEDSMFLCLVQDNFLTQHVLEPTRAARVLDIVNDCIATQRCPTPEILIASPVISRTTSEPSGGRSRMMAAIVAGCCSVRTFRDCHNSIAFTIGLLH